MNVGKTLFARVMAFVPWTSFGCIVQRFVGDAGVRSLTCAGQFWAMAFAKLTWRESLRDIEARLLANAMKLYAVGFRSAVRRSTLADASVCVPVVVTIATPSPPVTTVPMWTVFRRSPSGASAGTKMCAVLTQRRVAVTSTKHPRAILCRCTPTGTAPCLSRAATAFSNA